MLAVALTGMIKGATEVQGILKTSRKVLPSAEPGEPGSSEGRTPVKRGSAVIVTCRKWRNRWPGRTLPAGILSFFYLVGFLFLRLVPFPPAGSYRTVARLHPNSKILSGSPASDRASVARRIAGSGKRRLVERRRGDVFGNQGKDVIADHPADSRDELVPRDLKGF